MKRVNIEATALNIKRLMHEKNVTAIQMAEYAKVSLTAVYKWTSAKNLPGLETALALMELFELSKLEELYVFEGD